jgi:hypothetical protein
MNGPRRQTLVKVLGCVLARQIRQVNQVGQRKMAEKNSHFAVCETYRQAISELRAECDLAARAVCERDPGVRPGEARRRVAKMLCNDPPGCGITGESSFKLTPMEFSK